MAISIALTLLLGVGIFLFQNLESSHTETTTLATSRPTEFRQDVPGVEVSAKSIAVLPFANLSPGEANEYLSDGIAEEIRHALTNLTGLQVAARASSILFKGAEDIRNIGEQLHVSTVLEGSVLQAGNRLRVTVQLSNVADGYQLWSERYDKEMTTIFDIQDSIAQNIVARLKLTLEGSAESLVSERHPENVEAYALYLNGRFHADKYEEPELRRAIAYFEEALEEQADYALAYAGLADAYGSLDYFGHVLSESVTVQIRSAIAKALELDSTLAAAYFSRARLEFNTDWDSSLAELDFKRALELDPSDSWKHGLYAIFLATQGRHSEAINEAAIAQQLDPLSVNAILTPGWIYFFARDYDQALAAHSGETDQ